MMRDPTTFSGLHGETATYEFRPEYVPSDWKMMASLIDDATLRGLVNLRFLHDDCVKVIITNGSTA